MNIRNIEEALSKNDSLYICGNRPSKIDNKAFLVLQEAGLDPDPEEYPHTKGWYDHIHDIDPQIRVTWTDSEE